MASITHTDALNYQKQAVPIAKQLYASNADYRKYVIAYYLHQRCGVEVKRETTRLFNLTPGQANVLFYAKTGYWNFKNGNVPYPVNDKSYVNLFYIQRCYLAMSILAKRILQSPQAELYKKLLSLENKMEDYNYEHYLSPQVVSNGAAFVNSPYSDYHLSLDKLKNDLGMITPPDTRRYMYAAEGNTKAKDLALKHKKDPKEFCVWNKIRDPEVVVPSGYVYFGGLK